jgi:hypothetical protein
MIAQSGGDSSQECVPEQSVRASLYRATVKLHAAVQDVLAIIDDCAWWDALTRRTCTAVMESSCSPDLVAALARVAAEGPARCTFDDMRHRARGSPDHVIRTNGIAFSVFQAKPLQQ